MPDPLYVMPDGRGNDMLARAIGGLEPEDTVRASCATLAGDLQHALNDGAT